MYFSEGNLRQNKRVEVDYIDSTMLAKKTTGVGQRKKKSVWLRAQAEFSSVVLLAVSDTINSNNNNNNKNVDTPVLF